MREKIDQRTERVRTLTENSKQQKNPTTNYRQDSHKAFCERCYSYNHGCPNTRTGKLDPNCSL